MKHTLGLLIALFLASASTSAQVFDPVDWTFSAEATGDGEYTLTFEATIDKGWYVYAQDIPEDGPVPTSFTFEELDGLEVVGAVSETSPKIKTGFDKVFEMDIKKFASSATFTQQVRYSGSEPIKGFLEYMTCNDERCLPPEMVDFVFDLTQTGSGDAEEAVESADDAVASSGGAAETVDEVAPSQAIEGKPRMESTKTAEEEKETAAAFDASASTIGDGFGITGSGTDYGIGGDNGATDDGILEPVDWTLETEGSGDDRVLVFRATIDEGWYVYSSEVPEDGPIATTINWEQSEGLQVEGGVEEDGAKIKEGMDPIFNLHIKRFAESAEFRQRVKLLKREGVAKGFVEHMVCDNTRCLAPQLLEFTVDLSTGKATFDAIAAPTGEENSRFKPVGKPVREDCAEAKVYSSWWIAFLLGIGGGLLALLTPCVFPMIPLTVSFFTKKQGQSRSRGLFDASFYGLSIFMIYFLLSLPFLIFQIPPDTLNAISTSVPLNIIFFVVFIVFAISFFGYFELTLPSGFATKVDKASGIGGILGIFFMALTLAIVSFSCTGPILGSLLGSMLTAEGGQINLVAGMSGFGISLGLPFALFAAFPKMLEKLPRSGDWMDRFKKTLGFLELGLALKFLSNADLVAQWGLLKREVFLGIWILIGLAWILHTAGILRLPHDAPRKRLSAMAWATILVIGGFCAYLFSGLFGNNLQFLSGFPPPMHYSILHHDETRLAQLTVFRDLEEGQAYARENNKALMLDFTGWACVNCRKMEENVWVKDPIYQTLMDDYVIISLYVDEKIDLPDEDQYVSPRTGKKIRTVGNYWSDYEISVFNNNSQPLYALMTPDLELLSHPVGYMPDEEEYHAFLTCGLQAYEEVNGLASASGR